MAPRPETLPPRPARSPRYLPVPRRRTLALPGPRRFRGPPSLRRPREPGPWNGLVPVPGHRASAGAGPAMARTPRLPPPRRHRPAGRIRRPVRPGGVAPVRTARGARPPGSRPPPLRPLPRRRDGGAVRLETCGSGWFGAPWRERSLENHRPGPHPPAGPARLRSPRRAMARRPGLARRSCMCLPSSEGRAGRGGNEGRGPASWGHTTVRCSRAARGAGDRPRARSRAVSRARMSSSWRTFSGDRDRLAPRSPARGRLRSLPRLGHEREWPGPASTPHPPSRIPGWSLECRITVQASSDRQPDHRPTALPGLGRDDYSSRTSRHPPRRGANRASVRCT